MNKYPDTIKLNLGCGLNAPHSWQNYDSSLHAQIKGFPFVYNMLRRMNLVNKNSPWPENVKYLNLNKELPWKNDSVDIVYLSHVLEHLSIPTTELFLTEARRILKPNGVIRIVVPDMLSLAKEYINTTGDTSSSIDQLLWAINLGMPVERSFFKQLYDYAMGHPSVHKYMYDHFTLSSKLLQFGFCELESCSYGRSKYIVDIEVLECTSGYNNSLYVEAKKTI